MQYWFIFIKSSKSNLLIVIIKLFKTMADWDLGLTWILGLLGSWADWDLGLTGILSWLGSWADRDLGLARIPSCSTTILIIKVANGSKFKLINIVEFSHTQGMLCSYFKDLLIVFLFKQFTTKHSIHLVVVVFPLAWPLLFWI